jgi:hypothetical protein
MGTKYAVYRCQNCDNLIKYDPVQESFYCQRCGQGYEANPHAHLTDYASRPNPRWRMKFKNGQPLPASPFSAGDPRSTNLARPDSMFCSRCGALNPLPAEICTSCHKELYPPHPIQLEGGDLHSLKCLKCHARLELYQKKGSVYCHECESFYDIEFENGSLTLRPAKDLTEEKKKTLTKEKTPKATPISRPEPELSSSEIPTAEQVQTPSYFEIENNSVVVQTNSTYPSTSELKSEDTLNETTTPWGQENLVEPPPDEEQLEAERRAEKALKAKISRIQTHIAEKEQELYQKESALERNGGVKVFLIVAIIVLAVVVGCVGISSGDFANTSLPFEVLLLIALFVVVIVTDIRKTNLSDEIETIERDVASDNEELKRIGRK